MVTRRGLQFNAGRRLGRSAACAVAIEAQHARVYAAASNRNAASSRGKRIVKGAGLILVPCCLVAKREKIWIRILWRPRVVGGYQLELDCSNLRSLCLKVKPKPTARKLSNADDNVKMPEPLFL